MALDKNDGTFSPSIEGVISGKTSQVSGMNGLLNDLIGNDNYLNGKKLDKGSYTGTAEDLSNDIKSRLPYVNTIEDLKKQTKYAVGDVVEVLGYYTKGDGAGHPRQKKPVGYTGADAVIGADGSIWGIVHSGEVNVSWFGAKGDGISDDTIHIQNAINFSENIKINKGKFLISRLNFPYTFANKSFAGSGYGIWRDDNSTIFVAKETIDTMFYYADGANFIETSNFNIDCKGLANIGLGSYYELKENGHYGGYECFGGGKNIHRIYVKNAKYTGIMLGALSTADKVRVTGCDIEVQSDSVLNDIEVSGGKYGIVVSAGGNFLN
ncbi:MAG: glycosyl hydrolase family 28-related protein, partial [Paraclostridium sp.]